eukprot:TRINITY_DN533_c0_g1_i11.p1 TRINITY_DN533_c0_g1~~TRINITY_DN533_c0_g1_i11.p1  ORF type:complete len:376 (-),score=49.11 TRINITY_DN533_c0_g1_i11:40-1167(-)
MGCCKICGGCSAFVVLCVAVLAGLLHQGHLSVFGPFMARFLDEFGNAKWTGLTPAMWGSKPWRFEYSMLPDLSGRVALVTGANVGLGYWTAHHLALRGAHVFVGCRSEAKCSNAIHMIKSNYTSAKVDPAILDVSSLSSVRAFGDKFLKSTDRLDILVLNAGIGSSGAKRSVDAIEPVFATNHVGHQLLYLILEDLILKTGESTGDARVVAVSSTAHFESWDDGVALTRDELNKRWDAELADKTNFAIAKAYPQSKLANVLFAQEAARRMTCKPVFVNSLHPGAVSTEIFNKSLENSSTLKGIINYFAESFWSPEEGALTQVYLAAANDIKDRDLRGRYFHPQAVETQPCARFAHNLTLQKALWSFTDQLIEGRG